MAQSILDVPVNLKREPTQRFLRCPKCGTTSYSVGNLAGLYCSHCCLFLEDEARRLRGTMTEQERFAARSLGYEYVREIGVGWIGVYRESAGFASVQLCEGIGVFAHYQYLSFALAVVAAGYWNPSEQGEPIGWLRKGWVRGL